MSDSKKTSFLDHDLSTCHPGDVLSLEREEAHHLFTVRRAQKGDVILVLDGRGHIAEVRCEKKNVVFTRLVKTYPRPKTAIHLYAAQLKLPAWEWLLEKCTELCVTSVHPIISQYVEPRVVETARHKAERLRKFCIDGMKQSGSPFLPELKEPQTLAHAVDRCARGLTPTHRHMMAVEPHADLTQGQAHATARGHDRLPSDLRNATDITLWVGPEGGWGAEDRKTLDRLSPFPVTFAQVVFRAETAALFFISNILYSVADGHFQGSD